METVHTSEDRKPSSQTVVWRTSPMRIGMLVPSSNTVVEPVTQAILGDDPRVTLHFARFRFSTIALTAAGAAGYALDVYLEAAAALADAKVDCITWNGTSTAWKGMDNAHAFVRAVKDRHGIAASTTTLACLAALRAARARRIGLLTPFPADMHRKVTDNLAVEGFDVVAGHCLERTDNFALAGLGAADLLPPLERLAEAGPDALLILCTNLDAARLAADLEARLGLPVIDSVAATAWDACRTLGLGGLGDARWGRVYVK